MPISLQQIVTGMNGGPEAIQQNFNKVKAELERMNGSVVEIPKEQFTALNGVRDIDRNSCGCTIFKFNQFAIMQFNAYVALPNMKGWTYLEAVSVPKSYFNGYSKFILLGETARTDDDNMHYNSDFHLDKGLLSIYTRGAEWNNKGVFLSACCVLYN